MVPIEPFYTFDFIDIFLCFLELISTYEHSANIIYSLFYFSFHWKLYPTSFCIDYIFSKKGIGYFSGFINHHFELEPFKSKSGSQIFNAVDVMSKSSEIAIHLNFFKFTIILLVFLNNLVNHLQNGWLHRNTSNELFFHILFNFPSDLFLFFLGVNHLHDLPLNGSHLFRWRFWKQMHSSTVSVSFFQIGVSLEKIILILNFFLPGFLFLFLELVIEELSEINILGDEPHVDNFHQSSLIYEFFTDWFGFSPGIQPMLCCHDDPWLGNFAQMQFALHTAHSGESLFIVRFPESSGCSDQSLKPCSPGLLTVLFEDPAYKVGGAFRPREILLLLLPDMDVGVGWFPCSIKGHSWN